MTTPPCDRCPAVAEWLAYSAYLIGEYNEDGEPGVEHWVPDVDAGEYAEPREPHPLVGHYPAAIIRACSRHLHAELSDCLGDDLIGLPAGEELSGGGRWVVVPTAASLAARRKGAALERAGLPIPDELAP